MNGDLAANERQRRARSQLFTVRLWKEKVDGGWEYRGSVQDVISGAFRGFRNWSNLAAFMIERVEEEEPEDTDRQEPAE